MKNISLFIIDNVRLDFKESREEVFDFIKKRSEKFATKIELIKRDEIDAKIKNSSGYRIFSDILNPILDWDLVAKMIDALERTKTEIARPDGAVPGTQPDFILAPYVTDSSREGIKVRWDSQQKYNNQFNLYKYKRLKMFLKLLELLPNFHALSIPQFIAQLENKKIFEKLAAFAQDLEMRYYKSCPHCGGELVGLQMTMSQPFCGYLPVSKPLYHECVSCGLVVSSPYIASSDLSGIYDEFDKQDFVASHNNPYTPDATRCKFIADLQLPQNAATLDLGGGIGNFSKYLKTTYPKFDVTHADFEIKKNPELQQLGIKTMAIDFVNQKIEGKYDLITAWEVIEHIPFEKLKAALKNIHDVLKPGGIFVFSTPDFDSPLCQMNDFFAICPPFHYTVFGKKWLTQYFSEKMEWRILRSATCSDFLDDSEMWCDYASKTAPSFQLRATAKVAKVLMKSAENKKLLLDEGIGTEILFALRKNI